MIEVEITIVETGSRVRNRTARGEKPSRNYQDSH